MNTMTMNVMTAMPMTPIMMSVQEPTALYERFAAALNAADLEAVMALFDSAGQTVPQPGQPPVTGLPAIRGVMQQCLALKPQIHYERMCVMQADDVALLRAQWGLKVILPDGNPMELTGKGVQVARRQPDGSWRLLIDNPWAGE